MNSETEILAKLPAKRSPSVLLLLSLWAALATLVAVASSGLAAYLLFREQHAFLRLPDRAVAGQYRWIESEKETLLTFHADHSFTQEGGPKYPFHRWEVSRDGALLVVWQAGVSRFTRIVAPGVYDGVSWNNQPVRLERQERVE